MSFDNWPWSELDLNDAPEDIRSVKRAYAKRLKRIDQQNDVAAFKALREAYEYALHLYDEQDNHNSLRRLNSAQDKGPLEIEVSEPQNSDFNFKHDDEPAKDAIIIDVNDNLASPDEPVKNGQDFSISSEQKQHVEHEDNSLYENIKVDHNETNQEFNEDLFEEDDWDYLNDLADRIYEQIVNGKDPFNIDVWKTIFDDPKVVSFSAKRFIEEQVFSSLLIVTAYNTEHERPIIPPGMTREFVKLLDDTYGWVSDGIAIIKRYGDSGEWLLRALTAPHLRLQTKSSMNAPKTLNLKPIKMPFLLRWYVLLIMYFGYRFIVMLLNT